MIAVTIIGVDTLRILHTEVKACIVVLGLSELQFIEATNREIA
jgi:hypothetical protein